MLRIDHKDWLRVGIELFGEDRTRWRFRCAACGHVQSAAEIAERAGKKPSASVYMNCEGRTTPGVGCDWTLGGLLRCHKLEVFDPARGATPVFEFAHERAAELVAEAAARFVMPVHFESDATSWDELEWPEWVPTALREQIQKFWAWHGGPQTWIAAMKRSGCPVLGARVELPRCTGDGDMAEGRFVFAWNNVGRVVQEDGSYVVVSF